MKILGRQVAAARELAGITQAELGVAAGVTEQTINRLEKGRHAPREETLHAIREALERRGIEFTNGKNPGVRFVREKVVIPTS